MKIKIKFQLRLEVNKPNQNYTGIIVLKRRRLFAPSLSFSFLVLNPYNIRDGEIAIYDDLKKESAFSSAVARGTTGTHPESGKPIVAFDFSEEDPEKLGLTFVVVNIISEAIYRSEKVLVEMRPQKGQRPVIRFKDKWEQDFSGSEYTMEMARKIIEQT
jgi:hypothetical protein